MRVVALEPAPAATPRAQPILLRVFERFFQVDGGITRRFQGMGIGLALCRAIVEAHGDRIWVESLGEGRAALSISRCPQWESMRVNRDPAGWMDTS